MASDEASAGRDEASAGRDEVEAESATGYGRTAVIGSAVVGVVLAYLSVAWAAGNNVWHEELFRTAPTVEGGGIGTGWLIGNTNPFLDFLIALVHAADVIMGAFILVMVFVHWAAFRRIAARMRTSGARERTDEVVADGGRSE